MVPSYLYLVLLVMIPLIVGFGSFFIPNARSCRQFSAIFLWVQLALVAFLLRSLLSGDVTVMNFYLGFSADRISAFFIVLVTFMMACATTHADYFFATEEAQNIGMPGRSHRKFYAATNLFLVAMTYVFICDSLGYLWISVEATTLTSAYLVYYDKTKNSLEATWKYLMICTVAIGFALLGTVFIFASSQNGAIPGGSLYISDLIAHADQLNFPLLKLGFMFCLIGYGTKAGVFPLYSWMPDAYSEAPAPASAMLAGALINVSLFAIWRVKQIIAASAMHSLIEQTVTIMGVITIIAGSLLLIRQQSFKRMWAYSSIENTGLMLVAIGMNFGGLFLLHAINHSFAKVTLFLVSGDIIHASGTKKLGHLQGVLKACPLWGVLLALATFALTGCPPFGSFLSEMTLLLAMADAGRFALVAILVIAIGVSFVAICVHVGRILFGGPKAKFSAYKPVRASVIPAILICCSLAMGTLVNSNFWINLK